MRRRRVVAAGFVALGLTGAFVAACSSDSFSTPDGGTDAASSEASPDVTGGDAADGGALSTCDPDTPFQTVTPVTGLNDTMPDYHPAFTADELRVIYARNTLAPPIPDAGYQIPELWESTRSSADAGWGSPLRVAALNANSTTWDPTLSPDGLTVYFSSTRLGTQNLDIFVATRPSFGSEFGTPSTVQPLVTIEEEASPYFLPGKAIYFARGTQGGAQLFRAPITGSNVGPGVAIDELNTPGDERYPVVSADELTMYFARRPLNGTTDIMLSRRGSASDKWGTPTAVGSVNVSFADDWPGWLSPDLCVFYFSSTRAGNGDIYRAVRNK